MALIPGTIPLTGTIAPTDSTDTFAITDPIYAIDGLRNVADESARNAIPEARRRSGMLVGTQDTGVYWKLLSAPWSYDNADWEFFLGESGEDSDWVILSPESLAMGVNGKILPYDDSINDIGEIGSEFKDLHLSGFNYLDGSVYDSDSNSLIISDRSNDDLKVHSNYFKSAFDVTGFWGTSPVSDYVTIVGDDLYDDGGGTFPTNFKYQATQYDETSPSLPVYREHGSWVTSDDTYTHYAENYMWVDDESLGPNIVAGAYTGTSGVQSDLSPVSSAMILGAGGTGRTSFQRTETISGVLYEQDFGFFGSTSVFGEMTQRFFASYPKKFGSPSNEIHQLFMQEDIMYLRFGQNNVNEYSAITFDRAGFDITADKYIHINAGTSLDLQGGGVTDYSKSSLILDNSGAAIGWDLGIGGIGGRMNIGLNEMRIGFDNAGNVANFSMSATGNQLESLVHTTVMNNITQGLLKYNIDPTTTPGWDLRSIPDKKYVDDEISSNGNLSTVLSNGNTTGGTDIFVSSGDKIELADGNYTIQGLNIGFDVMLIGKFTPSFTGVAISADTNIGTALHVDSKEALFAQLSDTSIAILNDWNLKFRTSSALNNTYIQVGSPVGNQTLNLPDGSGTFALVSDLQSQIMSRDDKFMIALTTVLDGDLASNSTITNTPVDGCYVEAKIEGVEYEVGDGVSTKACYFATPGSPHLPKGFDSTHPNGQIEAGDMLYWNGSIVGFQLIAGSRVSLNYLISI